MRKPQSIALGNFSYNRHNGKLTQREQQKYKDKKSSMRFNALMENDDEIAQTYLPTNMYCFLFWIA